MIDVDRKSDNYPPTLGKMARLVLEQHQAGESITLAINGKTPLIVAGDAAIRRLFELIDHLETVALLDDRLRSVEAVDRGIGLDQLRREMHDQQGTPL